MNAPDPAGVLEHLCALFSLSLAHFLWQGVLIAVAGAAAATALRHRSAATRYRLHAIALLAMAACPIATLSVLELSNRTHQIRRRVEINRPIAAPKPVAPAATEIAVTPGDQPGRRAAGVPMRDLTPPPTARRVIPASALPPPAPAEPSPRLIAVKDFFNTYAYQIVAIYLLGVTLMMMRTAMGLQSASFLRRSATPVKSERILQMLRRRAMAMGLRVIPPLAASSRVVAPCLIGVLKPIILVPTAVLNSLSVEQLEAILAHELAHLRRYDHWISLVQRIIEAALFFHPAVWWVSRQLSKEREMCCDDLVVAKGSSRILYAESLVRVAEMCRSARVTAALAATGRPSELRRRVARLLGEPLVREFVPHRNWLATVFAPLLFAIVLTLGFLGRQAVAQSAGRVLFEDTFEHGARGEWSKPVVCLAPGDQRQFLGPFNTDTIELNLRRLPAHRKLKVSFDMLVMRSWDGNDSGHGPDVFCVATGDGRVLYYTSFSSFGVDQSFPGYFGVHSAPAWTGATQRDALGITYNGEPKDGTYRIECAFPHAGEDLTLRFMVGTDGDINDEAWGLDNVRVTVDDAAAPSAADLAKAWQDLGADDVAAAAKAVQSLVAGGDQTIALLSTQLAGAKLPAEMVLLNPARFHFQPAGAEQKLPYSLADPALRRIALGAHVLQLIGNIAAKAALEKLQPPEPPAASVATLNVRDKETGKPLAFVPLLVRTSGAYGGFIFTDSAGQARTVLTPQSRALSFRAPRNVFLPLSKSTPISADSDTPPKLDIQLEKGTSIGGIVTDESHQPIAGAIIKIELSSPGPESGGNYSYWDPHAMTDRDGRWSFDLVPSRVNQVRIGVFHPRFGIGGASMIPMAPYEPLAQLREGKAVHMLRGGVPVEGIVYSHDGNPIAGAWVDWGRERGVDSTIVPPQATDAHGRFVYTAFPGTSAMLTVRAKGQSPDQRQIRVGNDPMELRFDLRPAKVLSGRVVDPVGAPLVGARVYVGQWRGMALYDIPMATDADGRFTWDGAPDEEIVGSVYKADYNSKDRVTFRAGEENLITLAPPSLIRGTVVDDETGEPIKKFQLTIGIASAAGRPISWQRGSSYGNPNINQHEFSVRLSDRYPGYALRAEAEGYLPADSAQFAMDVPERAIELRLRRGASTTGTVRDGADKPVAGAQVFLIPPQTGIQLTNGRLQEYYQSSLISAKSGADGKFVLPPQAEQYLLLVLHDSGVARVGSEDFTKSGVIKLEAWATVEGVVKQGGQPLPGAQVGGPGPEFTAAAEAAQIHLMADATTDSQGRFRLERVVPGSWSIGRRVQVMNGFTFSNHVRVNAIAGEVTQAAIGGTGRAVTGRVIVPDPVAKGDWVGQRGQMFTPVAMPQPKRPDNFATMTPQQRQDWNRQWQQTDEGKAYVKAAREAQENRRAYPLSLNKDGTFRVEDVEPGTYELHFSITAPTSGSRGPLGQELAVAHASLVVPGGSVGVSDAPALSIPPIQATVIKRVEVGESAPPFTVPSLDGKPIKLEDYRGKYVLLDFWAAWCGPCITEIPHYKQVFDAFSKDERFVMLSLSLDPQTADAKAVVEKEKLGWMQGFLGEWSSDKITPEYGVRSIPSVWLIGPDGKVIAKDLRGEAIKSAVERALKR